MKKSTLIKGALAGAGGAIAVALLVKALRKTGATLQPVEAENREESAEQGSFETLKEAPVLEANIGYGAAWGAVYGLLQSGLKLPGAVQGPLFGLGLWAVASHGWNPMLRLFPSSLRQLRTEPLISTIAYLAFSLTTAYLFQQLQERLSLRRIVIGLAVRKLRSYLIRKF